MRKNSRILPALLAFLLTVQWSPAAVAVERDAVSDAAVRCADYLQEAVKTPQVGSVGGEWTVIALARSGAEVPQDYWERYCEAVQRYTADRGGVLHQRKYTEYSRVVLALTAIGGDPAHVAGFNLLAPLGDFDKTIRQGINGAVWALIALDSGDYAVPAAPDPQAQATRQRYVDAILARQLPDGGWNMAGAGAADPDMTAMALQALARYQADRKVGDAVRRGVACLSDLQDGSGGYASQGVLNAESTAQVIGALCALEIPLEDPRFVKNGNTLTADLLRYQQADGSFCHTEGGPAGSLMATEQALCALAAILRQQAGAESLYRMTDTHLSVGGNVPEYLDHAWKRAAFVGCALANATLWAVQPR